MRRTYGPYIKKESIFVKGGTKEEPKKKVTYKESILGNLHPVETYFGTLWLTGEEEHRLWLYGKAMELVDDGYDENEYYEEEED